MKLKNHRLRDKKIFTQLLNDKALFYKNLGFVILLVKSNKLNYSRMGIIIAKRQIKKACQRNMIKRLLRESFRNYSNVKNLSLDFIIIVKSKSLKLVNKDKVEFKLKINSCLDLLNSI